MFFRRGFLFFCKRKTAYDMRISDWSSDVCSSDLGFVRRNENGPSPGRTCEVGGEPRQESGGSTGQRHRLVGRKDFLEVGHLAGVLDIVDGLELLHHRAVP